MNIIDIVILIIIALGAVVGFKRGVFTELISALSFIVSVILAFLLKNPVSIFLYEHLPFFSFGGIFKGVAVINILLYEIIAFLIMLALFTGIFAIVRVATKLFERILKFTIVLSIPSKLLGIIVGAIHYYIIVFIALYVLSLPIFGLDILKESKFKNNILNNTPILSSVVKESVKIFDEFETLKDKYKDNTSVDEFNNEALDLMLKYKVVSVESADKLVELNKIKVDKNIINKYREV